MCSYVTIGMYIICSQYSQYHLLPILVGLMEAHLLSNLAKVYTTGKVDYWFTQYFNAK